MSDVFNEQQTPAGNNTSVTNGDNVQDLLKKITNENGEPKYKSLEDALVALDHSQKYIPELKNQLTGTNTELERMKAEMAKFGNIEETVQRLLAQRQNSAATTPEVKGLDEQAVRKLVEDSLLQRQQIEAASNNQKLVNDALVGKYGDKAAEVLEAKAKELQTSRQALGELAKQNPQLVLALFNQSAQKEANPTTTSHRMTPPKTTNEPAKPSRSMLAGATMKQQAEFLEQVRAEVHAKYGVTN